MSVVELPKLTPNDAPSSSLFPLPLTTLESFMIADGRPGNPMMCDIELEFQGALDRGAFETALAFALARNPLFTCRVVPAGGTLHWVPAHEMPPVRWLSLDAPLDDDYGALADLRTQIGMRIWVRVGAERAKVLLHFHHACADAIGSFGFLGDLLSGYAMSCPGDHPVLPRTVDAARLAVRGEAGLGGRSLPRRIYDAINGAKEGLKFFWQSPQPLAPATNKPGAEPNSIRPTYVTAMCSEEVTSGVRRAASAAGATANDVLLRDLYLVMRRWNSEHGAAPGRRRLRILMPQNLRDGDDYAMPAANVMSFAFVTRGARWCDTPGELLESIREETEAVRRGKLSLYFLGGLETLRSRGLLSTVLNRPFCFATAILTNLGDPTRRFGTKFARCAQGLIVGNVVLSGMAALPPLRPRTRAAFSIINHGTRLSISLKWDPTSLSPLDAEQLLGHYVAQLQATAESAGADCEPATLARTAP